MLISKEHYKDLSPEELIQDEYFVRSVQRPDHESELFWKEFLIQYPQQDKAIATATAFVKQMRFAADMPSVGTKDRIWETVINQHKVHAQKRRRWLWAAASVVGLLLVLSTWMWNQDSINLNRQTSFGEIKKLTLPDGSLVVLNSNSSIKYKKKWNNDEVREVWLKGEAFFDVKHLNQGKSVQSFERFVVHTGSAKVEVLGTTFNVSDRQEETKVVLQTGKVKVDFKDKKTETLIMEPGELIRYNQKTKSVVKVRTDTDNQLSWQRKELILNNTSLREVINVIENNYGYKVALDDQNLLDRQISGTGKVSLDDEAALFKSLELILNVQIIKNDRQLLIKSH